jgi:hypothetical protein
VGGYEKRGKKQKGSGDERNKKINKMGGGGGDQKTKKKNPNGGERKKNQKKGFHEMAIEFNSLGQIHLTPSDGNQNGFGCHQIQLPPLDDEHGFSRHHQIWSQLSNGDLKRGNMTNPHSTCFNCPQGWAT